VVAFVGLGLTFIWPPGAIVSAFGVVAVFMVGLFALNTPTTRVAYNLAAVAFIAATYRATGSSVVAAAAFFATIPTTPTEPVVRALGYKSGWLVAIAAAASIALLAVGWTGAERPWVVLPAIAWTMMCAVMLVTGLREWKKIARPKWSVKVGEQVPDFTGQIRTGGEFQLSSARGNHVALIFLRGDWCPVCHVKMRIYQKEAANLAKLKVKVVLVSVSAGEESVSFAKDLGLDLTMLADPDCKIAEHFDAVQPNAFKGKKAALPSSFLIGPDGRLVFSSRPDDIASFLDPRAIPRLIEGAGAGTATPLAA